MPVHDAPGPWKFQTGYPCWFECWCGWFETFWDHPVLLYESFCSYSAEQFEKRLFSWTNPRKCKPFGDQFHFFPTIFQHVILYIINIIIYYYNSFWNSSNINIHIYPYLYFFYMSCHQWYISGYPGSSSGPSARLRPRLSVGPWRNVWSRPPTPASPSSWRPSSTRWLCWGDGCWVRISWNPCFFPTCQVRVVRFYVCSPLPPLHPPSSSHPPPCSSPTSSPSSSPDFNMDLQIAVWAAPDLNNELQIAVGSAGPQPRAPDCSGQRRTSTGGPWSGLGNAGPQPGGSGADWATPDLTRGPPKRSGQRRASAARWYVRSCVRNMSEKNVRKNVRRYVRRNVRKYVKRYVREECQKICQKRLLEEMSEDMSEEMSEDMSKDMSDKNVRRYVRRYVNRNVR